MVVSHSPTHLVAFSLSLKVAEAPFLGRLTLLHVRPCPLAAKVAPVLGRLV